MVDFTFVHRFSLVELTTFKPYPDRSHNRRKFLLDAVKSIVNQTLPKKFYEIIVIKNFDDDQIDSELNEMGINSILVNDKNVGLKVFEALKKARGKIVTFLDYEYKPERLKIIKERFDKYPNLVFYHNNFDVINEDGSISLKHKINVESLKLPLVANKKINLYNIGYFYSILDLMWKIGGFNNSCIAVRRQILNCDSVQQIKLSLDTYLFFRALTSGYDILIDDTKLTNYRVHRTNYSFKAFDMLAHDYEIIADEIFQVLPSVYRSLKGTAYWARLRSYLYGTDFKPSDPLITVIGGIKYWNNPFRSSFELGLAILMLLNRNLAKKLHVVYSLFKT